MNTRGVPMIMLSAVLLACCFQVTALAIDKPAAILHSSGDTTVNGNAAATTIALFNGDDVQTVTGVVTISAPGSTVMVPSSSELVLRENVVNLSSGMASINTTKGMTAQADTFSIAPATGTARFDVKRSGDLLEIHATSGALTVNSANGKLGVAEGQTALLHTGTGTGPAGTVNAAYTRSETVVTSGTSLFNLDKSLADDPSKVPYCSTAVCQHRTNVSGINACKCLRF